MHEASVNKATTTERQKLMRLLFMMLVGVSTGFFGGWIGAMSQQKNPGAFNSGSKEAKQIIENQSQLISSIAKTVGPSVVSVNVTTQTGESEVFGLDSAVQQQSAGTGFVISEDGYVITNRHVVPVGATSVSLTLSDGTKLVDVEVVGRTSSSDSLDIAFLKIRDTKGKKLVAAKLGVSSKMVVGDMVVAIGNALGEFQNTVTSGIVSGFGRNVQAGDQGVSTSSVENLQDLFQTDAAINEGNSGGPLVNANGEVIGINTAIAGNAQNIGFAIPVDNIKGLVKSVLDKGKLLRAFLGVRYVSLTDDVATQYGLGVKRGAYLAPSSGGRPTIIGNSPAEKAGLKEKDVITKVDNQQVDESNSLTSVLGRFGAGDKVTLTIVRDGKQQSIEVTLGTAPQN